MAGKHRKKKKRRRSLPALLTLGLVLLVSLAGYQSAGQKDTENSARTQTASESVLSGDLTVHFFDIGQGDCTILLQGEHAMLIDAGENDKGTAVQSYLNYLGVDTLDYVILTHPDSDHIGGADVILYKFDCETILMPDVEASTKTYDDVIQAMRSKGYTAVHPEVGDQYSFGDASFTVLSPGQTYEDDNNNSIVIRMDYGSTSFLFTGDAEEEAELDMLSSGLDLRADVLKVGHHGSSTSTSDGFLAAVSPEYAVISCGEDNPYGHPHTETMTRLRGAGVTIYRTDEQGTVIAVSDGQTVTWDESPSESWSSGEAEGSAAQTEEVSYILNTSSMRFHLPSCEGVADIASANRKESNLTREELLAAGYTPCGSCNP